MSKGYTVTMRGATFMLTRDQIEFDSPNYFTSCFLGEFVESQTRTVALSRDPEFFRIILDYLAGYEVLPLRDAVIPKGMNADVALRNLLVDAHFYLLDGLVDQIESSVNKPTKIPISDLSFHVMIIKSGQGDWEGPIPLDGVRVMQLQRRYGELDPTSFIGWNAINNGIQRVLRGAHIHRPYVVDSFWTTEDGSGPNPQSIYIILDILM